MDELLAVQGLSRRVVLRIRYFLAAPLLVAAANLVVTLPRSLARAMVTMAPLRLLPPPIEIPAFSSYAVWHERNERDPGHRWLREALSAVAAG